MQEMIPSSARFRELLHRGQSWGLLEVFAVTIYLSSALLFIPGAQAARTAIRSLPYLLSLALLAWTLAQPSIADRGWPGRWILLAAILILTLGLAHPQSNLVSGLAQIVLQISIAAPAWWAASQPVGRRRLERFLTLVFIANAASAAIGLLQIYYPDRFLPPEFSREAMRANPELLRALSFTGNDGRTFIRPPGLTDFPGGACAGCANTILLGLLMGLQAGVSMPRRFIYLSLAAVALVTLYLTQVRSMLLMSMVGCAAMCLLLVRQRRLLQSGLMAGVGAAMLAAAFLTAAAIGGKSIVERFSILFDDRVAENLYASRGIFLEYTFRNLVFEFPLGAGLGRWGMMRSHFIGFDQNPTQAIWVEIQITGWLIDGGIPLMIAYILAIAATMGRLYSLTHPNRGGPLAYSAAVIFCLNLFMIGQANAGPSFNSIGGLQFWLCTAVILAAERHYGVLARLHRAGEQRRRQIVAEDLSGANV